MKALVKTREGPGHVELKDIPVPEPREGDALIRVQAAALCGTDVHIFHDVFPNSPPVTLGHEFSGVVEVVGAAVQNVKPGDGVVSENNPFACGACRVCLTGYPNMCPQKRAMGIHSDGCFAEYVRLPAHLLHRIPEGVSFEAAALTEPLAVAVHAVSDRCSIYSDDRVVVMGPGTIGLLAAQVARAEGAGHVLVAGTSKDVSVRLDCARKLGLETFNVETGSLGARVMDLTAGMGADVVIEASGACSAVALGLDLLRRGGRMAVVGITGQDEISVKWDGLTVKGVTVCFAYSSRKENWDRALRFLGEKKAETLPLITHRMELDRWREAFVALERLESLRTVFEIGSKGNPAGGQIAP